MAAAPGVGADSASVLAAAATNGADGGGLAEFRAISGAESGDDAGGSDDEDSDSGSSGWIGWLLIGLVVLLVLAVGALAAGVASGRLDPARVPVVGNLFAGLQPDDSALVIEAEGRLTRLPSGALLLDVSGAVTNRGRQAISVPMLKATLMTREGDAMGSVARRWTIALPTAAVAPGGNVRFSSTLTDVPGGATLLRITTG